MNFNLKNLDNLSVEISDEQGLLSGKIYQKLITELKLKLMSSGIKVTSPDEASAKMFVIVNAIKSNFAEHRILVQLNIYENVITQRLSSVKSGAITFSDYSFFVDKVIEQAVYDKVMDTMIINFIENYLSQK
jgi:hypothetical protein